MHKPDRLSRSRAARSGDTCNGDGKIHIGVFERTERHRCRGFFAHRAERLDGVGIDAKHRVLGGIGVGDETAVDHVGRAGDFRERSGDKPARASGISPATRGTMRVWRCRSC